MPREPYATFHVSRMENIVQVTVRTGDGYEELYDGVDPSIIGFLDERTRRIAPDVFAVDGKRKYRRVRGELGKSGKVTHMRVG